MSSHPGDPSVRPISAATMNTPDPIMLPATSMVASVSVRALTNSCFWPVAGGDMSHQSYWPDRGYGRYRVEKTLCEWSWVVGPWFWAVSLGLTTNHLRRDAISSSLRCLCSYPGRIADRRPVPLHRRPKLHLFQHRLDLLVVSAVLRLIPAQERRIPFLVNVEVGGEFVRPDLGWHGNGKDGQIGDRRRVGPSRAAARGGPIRRSPASAVTRPHPTAGAGAAPGG